MGEDPDDPADVDREDRVQEREVVDAGLGVAVVHADLGRVAGRALEPVALHEEARERAAGKAREHEPHRGAEHPDLERIVDAALGDECRRPRDRGAVSPEQGDAAGEYAHRQRAPEQGRDGDPEAVLQQHEHRDGGEQDDERPPAGPEVAHARVDPDGREEVDEQHVARGQLEGYLVPGDEVDGQNAIANNSPPVTGSGMLYSRRIAKRRLSAFPTKSTTMPAVTARNGRTNSTPSDWSSIIPLPGADAWWRQAGRVCPESADGVGRRFPRGRAARGVSRSARTPAA